MENIKPFSLKSLRIIALGIKKGAVRLGGGCRQMLLFVGTFLWTCSFLCSIQDFSLPWHGADWWHLGKVSRRGLQAH